MPTYRRRSTLPAPVDEAFAWHERPGALQRLSPPWEPVTVEQPPDGLAAGTRVVLRAAIAGPLRARWVAEHVEYDPPRLFRDVQRSGPFAAWDHRHRFEALGPERSALTDEVDYRLPLGALGGAVGGRLVRERIERMFGYRHRQLIDDLAVHRQARTKGIPTMHVAITGSSGLIGSALLAFLTTGGHTVTRLVRHTPRSGHEVQWDPDHPDAPGALDPADLKGVDAIIHLAGEGIGERRWSAEQKRRILESRVKGTALLARTLATMDDPPRTLVTASGIGYYGTDRGEEVLTEESSTGDGFLAEVCRQWEAAADPARGAGIRVVHVRTGIVQSPRGGQLGKQLPLFRFGVGGRLGSGRHWQSWIALDDTVGIYHHALTTSEVTGPINAVAPNPVTNAEYTRVLGRVLGRPTLLPVPKFGPALLLGSEGSTETAFASQRVLPAKAQATGYTFRFPDLESALRHLLGRAEPAA